MPILVRAVGACLFPCLCLAGGSAVAQTRDKAVEISIPSGNLADALERLGEQSGLQIMYEPATARGIRVAAVNGTLAARAALDRLLAQTDLHVDHVNEKTVVLKRAEAKQEPGRAQHEQAEQPTTQRTMQEPAERLEEITVTAQKRAERLQDVPISIAVLSGEQLDRATVEGISEALNSVPGVATTVASMGGTNVMIRGVTASTPVFAGSAPIAYYLDSVPFGLVKSAIAPDASAFDISRVEVLRGPQGTLYGASAQNGVVRILTQDANLDGFEFKGRTSVSTTDDSGENYRGDVALNVPIVEGKLAARVVAGYQAWSGWIERPNDEDANDSEIGNLRLKLDAQPTDRLSVGASAWLSRSDYDAPAQSRDNGQHTATLNEPIAIDYDVYGLKLGYEAAGFSVSSTTGYMDYTNSNVQDFGAFVGVPLALFTDIEADVLSQEVILNSAPNGAWRWSLGGFYRDAEDSLWQNNLGGGLPIDQTYTSESHALFGEVGGRFLDDKMEWTLGLRYFHDDVLVKENVGPLESLEDSYSATTPRAVLTWHPGAELTVYGSYSQGFRSGSPQNPDVIRAFPTFPTLRPDKLHNYEVGMKATLFDGRFAWDGALYFIDWQDVQQMVVVPAGGTILAAPVNGEGASGVGIDLGMTIKPVQGLTLGLNFSWNDLGMDADVSSLGTLLFEKGDRLNLSPETTAGGSIDYAFPLGGRGYQGRFSASAHYISEQFSTNMLVGVRTFGVGDALLIGRTSFSIDAPNNWTATLFVDNFNNEQGAVARNVILEVPDWSPRVRPRTLGLQLEVAF